MPNASNCATCACGSSSTVNCAANAAAAVYAANKIKVYMFKEERSTPELSYAIRHLNAVSGDMFSASHNLPTDNGKKVYDQYGGQLIPPHDQDLVDEVTQKVSTIHSMDLETAEEKGLLVTLGSEVDDAYHTAVAHLQLSDARGVNILYSPLHGTGLTSVYPVLKAMGNAYATCFAKNPKADTLCSTLNTCAMTGTLTEDMVRNWVCKVATSSDFPSASAYDKAKELGTDLVRIMSYRKEMILFGGNGAEQWVVTGGAWDKLMRMLEPPVRLAEEEGVTLVVETGNNAMITTGVLGRKMIDDIGSNNLKLLWDPANSLYANEPTYPDGWEHLKGGYLGHLHIKDVRGDIPSATVNMCPLGTGDMAPYLEPLAQALKDDGYQGGISLENVYRPEGGTFEDGFHASLAEFKRIFG